MAMNRHERRAAKARTQTGTPPPEPLQAALHAAIAHHHAGDLARAEAGYRDILAASPDNPDALNLLGVVAHQKGDPTQALELIGRALKRNDRIPLYHNNMGAALRALGRHQEAADHYRRAAALEPSYAEAHNNLGNTLMDLGRAAEAVEAYERAVALAPDHAEPHTGLGTACMALDRLEPAGRAFRRAVELAPRSALAHRNLANLLEREGDRVGARDHLVRATELAPDDPSGWYQLGSLCREEFALEDAERHLRRALALDPERLGIRYSLGLALKDLDRLDEAEEQLRAAIALDADDVESWNSLANLLKEKGEWEAALETHYAAVRLDPSNRPARANLALTELTLGQFDPGWTDYLDRPSVDEKRDLLSRAPLEDDLSDKRLFLVRDQGLGDEIYFLRFVRELKRRGPWIGYRTDPKIASMVARLPFVDAVFGPEEQPDRVDALLSPADLPYLLGHGSAEDIPPSISLAPQAEKQTEVAAMLAGADGLPIVGVTWRAGIQRRNRLSKVSPLEAIALALKDRPVAVAVLQRNPYDGEIETFERCLGGRVIDLTALNEDLEAMLAALDAMDDYVCVSNTNTHLRAALDRTSRVLVPFPPDYRWMAAGDESPWFPGTRTYRQTPDRFWDRAFQALAEDLEAAFPTR